MTLHPMLGYCWAELLEPTVADKVFNKVDLPEPAPYTGYFVYDRVKLNSFVVIQVQAPRGGVPRIPFQA